MLDEKTISIIEKAMQGDEKAFEELCHMKGRSILYIARKLLDDPKDAEDAVQEVMVYMYQNIQVLRVPEAFNVWLYRIVRSVCANIRRKENIKITPLEEKEGEILEERNEFLPHDYLVDHEKKKQLLKIVDELPERCKVCVLLFYLEGMSYAEVAAALEIRTKDVDNDLAKAKRLIRRKLNVKTEMKQFLDKSYAAAPVPILSVLLHEELVETISEQTLHYIATSWKQVVFGSAGAAAGNGKSIAEKSVKKGSALGSHITLGIVVTAGIAAGIITFNNKQEPTKTKQVEKPVTEQARPVSTELDEELIIHTLADMIGIEEEQRLSGYAEDEFTNIEEVEEFLEEVGLEPEENTWKPVSEEEDTLYVLVKQDKMLMLIIRYMKQDDLYGVSYQFTGVSDSLPEDAGISLCYEEWKYRE